MVVWRRDARKDSGCTDYIMENTASTSTPQSTTITVFTTADMFLVGTLITLTIIALGAYIAMWKEVQLLRFTVITLTNNLQRLHDDFKRWWNKGC